MKKNYKKSDLNITQEKNYHLLSYEKEYFIPIKEYLMSQENLTIEYDIKGKKLSDIKLISYEKLEIIYKILEIVKEEHKVCEYKLTPNNIYVDFVGNVRIMERKVMQGNEEFMENKVREIKALLGFLYLNKNYEKLINTNNKALMNNKKVMNFVKMQTVEDMQVILEEMIKLDKKKFDDTKMVVNGKRHIKLSLNKNAYRVFLVLFFLIIVGLGFYVIPFKNMEVEGYTAYVEEDYSGTLTAYEGVHVNRMTKEDKYIYAISTIKTQTQINNNQKKKILASINNKTNNNILDYWVYIGLGNYEEANNKAIVINDVDMQIYALLLLIDQTQNDPDLDADTRQSQINTYEGQVDTLKSAKEELNAEDE